MNELLTWIMSALGTLDQNLLIAINGFHSEVADFLMPTITYKWTWVPFYLFLAYLVFRAESWKNTAIYLTGIIIAVVLADQLCASELRPMFERLRPSNPDNPISSSLRFVNDYRGGRYGFPSCHAANTFALATFLSLVFRRRTFTLAILLWAFTVSYSRLYLGVHYPSDVLAGALIGSTIALGSYSLSHFLASLRHRRAVVKPC